MRWHRQVVHVAAKDARYATRMLPLYALAILAVTLVAVGWPHLQSTTSESSWSLIAAAIGVLVLAGIVQLDSPMRADDFMATQPLSPTAVIAAKVLTCAAVIVVPALIAQLIVFLAYAIPRNDIAPLLTSSLGAYAEILLFAFVAAALTPDLRAFLLVIFIAVVSFTLGSLLPNGVLHLSGPVSDGLSDVALASYAVVILYQYITRDTRRSRMAALVATGVGIGVSSNAVSVTYYSFAPPDTRAHSVVSIAGADTVRWPAKGPYTDTVRLSGARLIADAESPRVELRLDLSGSRQGDRLEFASAASGVYLMHQDGRRELVGDGTPSATLNAPVLPVGVDAKWLTQRRHSDSAHFEIRLTPEQAAALASGDATLHVEGTVATNRARVIATVPVRRGAMATATGSRIQIDSVARTPAVWLHLASVERPEGSVPLSTFPFDSLDFVASNGARREMVELAPTKPTTGLLSFPAIGATGHTTQLQLVEAPASTGRADDGRSMIGSRSVPVDTTWLRGAQLLVVRWFTARTDGVRFAVPPAMFAHH